MCLITRRMSWVPRNFDDGLDDDKASPRTTRAPSARSTVAGYADEQLDYTAAEHAQVIPGLEQGPWLKGDANYKHSVTIENLRSDKSYRFTVTQDGARFAARFRTAPTSRKWKDIRIIAFSDTETEPFGRVEHASGSSTRSRGTPRGRPSAGARVRWGSRSTGSTTLHGEFTLRTR